MILNSSKFNHLNRLKHTFRGNFAFTLIELLVVIAIIGILSALIIVGMSSTTQKATIAKSQVFANSLRNSLLSSLVSEWKLEGNANDNWGSNNGTLSDALGACDSTHCPQLATSCVSGNCLDFDGTGDYIDYGDILRPSRTTNRTFSFWIHPDVVTGTVFGTGNGWSSAGGFSEFILASSTTIDVSYDILNSPWKVTFNCATEQSKWNYFTVSFDSVTDPLNITVSLYKNGSSVSSQTTVRRTSGGYNLAFLLGALSTAADNHKISFFNGQIDDFRVYEALIPTSQIQQNYFAGINKLFAKNQLNREEYQKRVAELSTNFAKE